MFFFSPPFLKPPKQHIILRVKLGVCFLFQKVASSHSQVYLCEGNPPPKKFLLDGMSFFGGWGLAQDRIRSDCLRFSDKILSIFHKQNDQHEGQVTPLCVEFGPRSFCCIFIHGIKFYLVVFFLIYFKTKTSTSAKDETRHISLSGLIPTRGPLPLLPFLFSSSSSSSSSCPPRHTAPTASAPFFLLPTAFAHFHRPLPCYVCARLSPSTLQPSVHGMGHLLFSHFVHYFISISESFVSGLVDRG